MQNEPESSPDASAERSKLSPEAEVLRIITATELLNNIPISKGTLRNWMANGTIPYIKLPGARRVLFDWFSVREALLRRQRGGFHG